MTQVDIKRKEVPVHTVAVSYTEGTSTFDTVCHAVSLNKDSLPYVEGATIATDIPLYLVAYPLETVERDGDDLMILFKKEKDGEVLFHSAHTEILNHVELAGYNLVSVPYIRSLN